MSPTLLTILIALNFGMIGLNAIALCFILAILKDRW
jgi:uncharacterized membrane protein YuzA (DUF378 family)